MKRFHRLSRRAKTFFVLGIVAILTLLPATPAWAHATLLETTPADKSVVTSSPAEVALQYDQPVSTAFGAVKVLAPDGTRVDTGTVTTRNGGKVVAEALKPNLASGTYTILWRVLSADTHMIFGAETFSVGAASATSVSSAQQDGQAAKDALAVGRGLLYTGLVLLLGGLAFLIVLWSGGRSDRRTRLLLWVGWGLTTAGTVAGVLFQGAYAAGRGLGSTLDLTLLGNVLGTRLGRATIVRLVLLVAAALLLRRLPQLRRTPLAVTTAGLALGVFATISVVGHAGSGDLDVLALPNDVLHMAAASAWLGGLAVLATALLRRGSGAIPMELGRALPRWSRYATGAVLILVLSGLFAGWRQVREWGALTGTEYGRLLLIKTGLVLGMLLFAAVGRSWVRRHLRAPSGLEERASDRGAGHAEFWEGEPEWPLGRSQDDGSPGGRRRAAVALAPTAQKQQQTTASIVTSADGLGAGPTSEALRRLRRSVLIESALGLVVLVVTSILVGSSPARESYFPIISETATISSTLSLHIDVGPARSGLNDMHFVYNSGGKPANVVQVSARWTGQGGSVVVPVELTNTSPGVYDQKSVELPAVGTWQLAVMTQTSEIDSATTLFTVRIR